MELVILAEKVQFAHCASVSRYHAVCIFCIVVYIIHIEKSCSFVVGLESHQSGSI